MSLSMDDILKPPGHSGTIPMNDPDHTPALIPRYGQTPSKHFKRRAAKKTREKLALSKAIATENADRARIKGNQHTEWVARCTSLRLVGNTWGQIEHAMNDALDDDNFWKGKKARTIAKAVNDYLAATADTSDLRTEMMARVMHQAMEILGKIQHMDAMPPDMLDVEVYIKACEGYLKFIAEYNKMGGLYKMEPFGSKATINSGQAMNDTEQRVQITVDGSGVTVNVSARTLAFKEYMESQAAGSPTLVDEVFELQAQEMDEVMPGIYAPSGTGVTLAPDADARVLVERRGPTSAIDALALLDLDNVDSD